MAKIIVIVESPGKIKKLQAILGDNYIVIASYGHIIDLDRKKLSIDTENNFEPEYSVIQDERMDKNKIISEIKKATKGASINEILLASDEDREGEMIAWSIAYVLNLDVKKAKRITFNSITKTDLEKAIKGPRKIDLDLVDAQKARRILDRIIGYKLSPILWSSIGKSLSAGRVQSVVTRLIVEKELEIKKFMESNNNSYFRFNATFKDSREKDFVAVLHDEIQTKKSKKATVNADNLINEQFRYEKTKTTDEKKAKELMNTLVKCSYIIESINTKDSVKSPAAPFTTSTLVQEASRKLGMSVKKTASVAQKLYEAGYITYMRTDSVNLSAEALDNIKKFVSKKYGNEYVNSKNYIAKNTNTQEAHEACRPTDVFVEFVHSGNTKGTTIGSDEVKLYSLIWKRTVASQMKPAKLKITDIVIAGDKLSKYKFITQISNIEFDGFLAVYNLSNIIKDDKNNNNNDDDEIDIEETEINSGIKLPKLKTQLVQSSITGNQEYEKPPTRYNEAMLIKKLDPKNLNIGRPSTYPTIISTIQKVDYVNVIDIEGKKKEVLNMQWTDKTKKIKESIDSIMLGEEKGKFVPTNVGIIVTEFLMKFFSEIIDYEFTALMEKQLDEIAEGKKVWYKVIKDFYTKFMELVDDIKKNKVNITKDFERVLGTHPKTGAEIVSTLTKYGDVVKMMAVVDKKKKAIYAPIKPPLNKDTITLKEALKILEYPKLIGPYKDKDVYLQTGKYGFYLKWGTTKISLNDMTEENANKIKPNQIEDLMKEKRKNILWEHEDSKTRYSILNGPYGHYIKVQNMELKKSKPLSVSLPKNEKGELEMKESDIAKFTLEQVKEYINIGMEKKKNRFKKKDKKTGEVAKKVYRKVEKKVVEKVEKKPRKKAVEKVEKKPRKKAVEKVEKKPEKKAEKK